jgi:general L-amino acid transport system substrate-binding protein
MELVAVGKTEELEAAYFASRCEPYAQWGPVLAIARFVSDTHALLPDGLARKPEVMIKRRGDDNWVGIANWTLSALLFVPLIRLCVGCAES